MGTHANDPIRKYEDDEANQKWLFKNCWLKENDRKSHMSRRTKTCHSTLINIIWIENGQPNVMNRMQQCRYVNFDWILYGCLHYYIYFVYMNDWTLCTGFNNCRNIRYYLIWKGICRRRRFFLVSMLFHEELQSTRKSIEPEK